MRKLFLFICIVLFNLLHLCSFAQPCTDLPQPTSIINKKEADGRILFFTNEKKNVINNRSISAEDITISRKNILDILKYLNKNDYDGLRIYFAVNKQNQDSAKLCLILAPTTNSETLDDNKDIISDDDKNLVYFADKTGVFKQVKLSTNGNIIKWKNSYVKNIIPKIETQFEAKYNVKVNETHSLWYSDKVLFKDDKKRDLYDYINKCKDVEQLIIHFATWTPNPENPENLKFIFKMDLVFELQYKGGTKKYLTFGAAEIKKYFEVNKGLKENKEQSGYTDTGLPCPPAKCP